MAHEVLKIPFQPYLLLEPPHITDCTGGSGVETSKLQISRQIIGYGSVTCVIQVEAV